MGTDGADTHHCVAVAPGEHCGNYGVVSVKRGIYRHLADIRKNETVHVIYACSEFNQGVSRSLEILGQVIFQTETCRMVRTTR